MEDLMAATASLERTPDDLTPYGGVVPDAAWRAEVRRLAGRQDAVLLAHNYQLPEIPDIADHTGDSLALSRVAAASAAATNIFFGVPLLGRTGQHLLPDQR